MIKIISFTDNPPPTVESGTFQEVLREWGHTWMWEGIKLSGEGGDDTGAWLSTAMRDNTLVVVTDGLYMKELYPNMNSCDFIFECSGEGGRLTRAFSEQMMAACSYRSELLGLLTIQWHTPEKFKQRRSISLLLSSRPIRWLEEGELSTP